MNLIRQLGNIALMCVIFWIISTLGNRQQDESETNPKLDIRTIANSLSIQFLVSRRGYVRVMRCTISNSKL